MKKFTLILLIAIHYLDSLLFWSLVIWICVNINTSEIKNTPFNWIPVWLLIAEFCLFVFFRISTKKRFKEVFKDNKPTFKHLLDKKKEE